MIIVSQAKVKCSMLEKLDGVDIAKIEEDIYNIAVTRRIRPSQFFVDYDKLRSGSVSESQFFRVLWENMGVKLSAEEEKALAAKYAKKDGRTDWRKFCEGINLPFESSQLNSDPRCQRVDEMEYLGTKRSLKPLDVSDEVRVKQLLRNLQKFYKSRGISLRTQCADFDTHHTGVINESQFYRSLPKPSELTDENISLLVHKYRDPARPGLVNYLNLANDLEALGSEMESDKQPAIQLIRAVNDYLPHQLAPGGSIQGLFDRIRVAVFKNGIRVNDFFKDYDKLHCGVISERQFVSALVLAVGKEINLTPQDCQRIAESYRTADGRVCYRAFTDMLENAFHVPFLEKKPTESVVRPPSGSLGRILPVLTDYEEQQVSDILDVIKREVKKRQLMLYQYFRDYDRSEAYTRLVTPSQFGRILHFLSISVSPENLRLLCRKFADQSTGDINYPAFVQAIDTDFVNYAVDRMKVNDSSESFPAARYHAKDEEVNIAQLMARIRHHVLVNRLRVAEFFMDFDPLRSSSITKSQFERCLSQMGLSSIGQHHLTAAQFEALCRIYENRQDTSKVIWTDFVNDLDSVFTQTGLEKRPSAVVPPSEIFAVPKPGTMDWKLASDDQKQFTEAIIRRLSLYISERRALVRPCFRNFDKHNNGHLSRAKFRQALTIAELHCSEAETQALEARFGNDIGVNYIAFVDELEPPESPEYKYIERLKDLRATNSRGALPERYPAKNLEEVLRKVKTKVFRERVRIHEWARDYDRRRSGRMLKTQFRRALDLCQLGLLESELTIIEDHYQSAVQPDFIDYLRFNSDIEAIFTTHNLEKQPTHEPQQFRPPHEIMLNELVTDKQLMVENCLDRIAERVRDTRPQLYPMFKDFDKTNHGAVSRTQFRRVLTSLELAQCVPTETDWIGLCDKFRAFVGGRDDVKYVDFCDEVYHRAGFVYRQP